MVYQPEIVQVVPFPDYSVDVYFSDGKIVNYDMKNKLNKGVFSALSDPNTFLGKCTILNDTLAWDLCGNGEITQCIDIDPDTLYALENTSEKLA